MKKLVLTTVCTVAMAGAAFAQGTVHWDTIGAGGYTAQTNSTTYSPLFGGGSAVGGTIGNTFTAAVAPGAYDWELLYLGGAQQGSAPTTLSALAAWADAGLSAVQTASAGRLGPLAAQSTTAATVPWPSGTSDNIMLVGWSANLGATWGAVSNMLANWSTDQIANAYIGLSVPGYINPNAGNPGAVIFGGGVNANGTPIQSTLTQLYLIPLTVVPEPTTLALAGLGGLGLMLFRRQRKS